MDNIIIFGGTLEGRQLAEYYRDKGVNLTLCVATEYGESLVESGQNLHLHSGRLNREQIRELIEKESAKTVIDATHPYAGEVTKNIKGACDDVSGFDVEYIRVLRQSSEGSDSCCRYFPNIEEAVAYLSSTEGNILLTTGSKELAAYSGIKDGKERVFARVLPLPDVMKQVAELGYQGKNLICMQGPFSKELNLAMINMLNIKFLVTKDTGVNGGFPQKVSAAQKANIEAVVIGRPDDEAGMSMSQCKEYVNRKHDLKGKRKVSVCGMGMGDEDTMTLSAKKAIEKAEAVIGARRLLQNPLMDGKITFEEISADRIVRIIDERSDLENIAVVMSGDTGFYSGATKLLAALEGREDLEVSLICGISSAVYFCNKIGQPWQDVKMYSAHGRKCNFAEMIEREAKTFFLLGGEVGAKEFLTSLVENNLGNVSVCIGENLSYDTEKITAGKAEELMDKDFEPLAVALVSNDRATEHIVTAGIPDESFIRGNVPMTKEEVRAVTLSKLKLTRNAVVYDIGAGTGSVALECAMQAYEGQVFAIEKNPEGCELIEKNKKNLGVTNLRVVQGTAPGDMADLPAPTHAFIGGSSGNMEQIISSLFEKNPKMRIVINTITLESLAETVKILKNNIVRDVDIVQMNVSKGKKAGGYNLMMGQNPVYVISFAGGQEDE